MFEPTWSKPTTVTIQAKPSDGVWQLAFSYVEGPTIIKIEAAGNWNYSPQFAAGPCSANGDLRSPFDPKKCICDKAPVGALIGRIGGSVADKDSASAFVVGSLFVRKLEKGSGPLYLTINDMWNGFGDNLDEIKVSISFSNPAPP